jgi:hypothetical protein
LISPNISTRQAAQSRSSNVFASSNEVTFKAIRFSALPSPSLAQGCQIDHGGSQKHPPSASSMTSARLYRAGVVELVDRKWKDKSQSYRLFQ